MDWQPGGTSEDIEDRRDSPGRGGGGGGFGGFGGPQLGIGGLIVVGILSLLFGRNFFAFFTGGGGPASEPTRVQQPRPSKAAESKAVEFVSFVLDDAQKTWAKILPEQLDRPYRRAKLVLFRDSVESACGQAESATGPFYCPGDQKVYLDLGFFDELKRRFGAPGEFAQAYVIAHEIGHHVQRLTGIEGKVQRARQANPSQANPLSVRLELQADCYAGIWGHSTQERNIIHENDVEAAMRAAAAIGDDRLQKMATGHVSPEKFTHGSSAMRMKWFQTGLSTGQMSACDTFARAENR